MWRTQTERVRSGGTSGRDRAAGRRDGGGKQRSGAAGRWVKGERYAGAREYVTGMARGQLTFIILTLMDYLIPYIPGDPSLALSLSLCICPARLCVSRRPSQSSAKYRIIFMDVFKLMHQGVPGRVASANEVVTKSKPRGGTTAAIPPIGIISRPRVEGTRFFRAIDAIAARPDIETGAL